MMAHATTCEPSDLDALEHATLCGRYELDRRIGEGGTALVYEAWDRLRRRAVAVKVLRPALARKPELRNAFLREALTVARLQHEGIVEVLDVGREGPVVFVVLELLRGETLAERCRQEGFLPWSRVRSIMRQICQAVQSCHEAGIVHRDIKPENIICIRDPDRLDYVKLVDFGIAATDDAERCGDGPNWVSGTPAYMAPETYRGVFDMRTDIYAAGVLMYYLLTGHKPFDGDSTSQLFEQHAHAQVPPPSSRSSQYLRPAIDFLILKALSKDPALRYDSMREFRVAIENVGWGLLESPSPGTDEPDIEDTRPDMPVTPAQSRVEVTRRRIAVSDLDTRA